MTATDVLVDLGRSHVRVVAGQVDVSTVGGAGLSDAGPEGSAAVVAAAVHAAVGTGAIGTDGAGARLAVCAPGVVTSPVQAARFADALAVAVPAGAVTVVSDSAAWQAGAFGGADGAVVAVGTGAVVVARQGGQVRRLDGLGLLLGDVGGGAWIGLQALRSAARSDGVLRVAATELLGDPSVWPGLLARPDLAPLLAALVPAVAAAARLGDDAARRVLDDAATGLAETLAGLPTALPCCLVGGVADVLGPGVQAATPGRTWIPPVGDAIDGLRVLLDDPGPFAAETIRRGGASVGAGPAVVHDTDRLPTEAVAAGTAELDRWPTERLVGRLASGHEIAVRAVESAVPALARAADLVAAALTGGGRLVYVGAGTPGRLAVQDAAELTPTFGLDPDRVPVLLAGGARAGSRAVENAEDDRSAAAADVDAARVGAADVVVGISASGRTPYVLAALARASERGATTVGISSVPGSPLSHQADVAVDLPTGPEVIAGSTRLGAGTAQKIALNTLSTAALVRAGATYGPWMVDVRATNDKLRRRAVRIVRDAARVDEQRAAAALGEADGAVPVALVMILAGVDAADARARLATAGSVRAAVANGPVVRTDG